MPAPPETRKDDRRTLFAWCMYDWANSAYITTAVGLLPIFFANVIVGKDGARLSGRTFRADTLWGFAVGLAGAISFLMAPVLGSMADFSSAKKRFLLFFAYGGAVFTTLFYFARNGNVLSALGLFVLSQICFVNANVFYDAFLPHISSDKNMDRNSARGYAFGYIGGGIQFLLALILITFHDRVGMSREQAARLGIGMAGVWWAGFTLFLVRGLAEPQEKMRLPHEYAEMPEWLAIALAGVRRTWKTTKRAARFPHLILFLVSFMLYNEGVQTVINMATIYGTNELHLDASALMATLLIIQFVAMGGSLLFGRLAVRIGTRPAIVCALVLWMGVVIYAYFLHTTTEFFILGVIVGLAMGGVQALSRSYYGSMIPEEASAEFYGFYTVFTKFSAIWGPWTFALITHLAGSARTAIVSLIVYFVAGTLLLLSVNEAKARSAKTSGIH